LIKGDQESIASRIWSDYFEALKQKIETTMTDEDRIKARRHSTERAAKEKE